MPLPLHPKRDEILTLRESGLTFDAIAKQLDMTKGAVTGICRRAGLCGRIDEPLAPKHKHQCKDCGRPIGEGKRLCGPCDWARHMAARRQEASHG